MSDILKLTLKQRSGLLTELQSDTVFGHFCWRMREMSGEENLIEFLKLFSEGHPIFTLSNSLFERDDKFYFPKPLSPNKNELKLNSKKEKIENFLTYKKSKDRKLINISELNKFLNGNKNFLDDSFEVKTDYPRYKEELRTSVEISRETFSSKEGQLFSYAPFYVEEKLNDPKNRSYSDTKTILLVKVIDENAFKKFNCKLVLEEIFNIGFGKKKSSGYGEFRIVSFEKFDRIEEPKDSNGFISLSNYLPSKEDKLVDYYYDFIVKYGKLGEEFALGSNPFKKPLVLFTPGSVFITKEKKDFYGRCTTAQEEILPGKSEITQFGFAFSLKANLQL